MADKDDKKVDDKKEDLEDKKESFNDDKKIFSESENKAREMGHRTKEEWVEDGKDPDAWVDAGEFLRRAPLYEGLHKANRTVKSLEKKLDLLYKHQEELVGAKVQQKLTELRAEKKAAAAENDVAKVVAIDEEIEKVKDSTKVKGADSKIDDDTQEMFDEWKSENEWYEKDEDMFAYANGIGGKLEKENPDWGPDKILKEVSKKTKKAFEWKFKNPNREAANKVGSSKSDTGTPAVKGKLPTYNDLPDEAKTMYKEFVKSKSNPHGIMAADDYLKQYAIKAGLVQESE